VPGKTFLIVTDKPPAARNPISCGCYRLRCG
jgi:hypothetical protein